MGRLYMRNGEFKERQLWLDFECAVSIALRVVADSIENIRKWFKDWRKKPVTKCVNLTIWLWPEFENMTTEIVRNA